MSHSLILPAHVGRARMAERARGAIDPTVEAMPRVAGQMRNTDEWFEQWKADIRARIGWVLEKFDLKLNRILVAKFVRPEKMAMAGGSELIMPDTMVNEDLYQGVAGLVLKLGPRCYEDSDVMTWTEADKCAVGDWVLMRRSDGGGFSVQVNGVDCVVFNDERGIKAVVPRPDVIY